jgi:hypothetical protein
MCQRKASGRAVCSGGRLSPPAGAIFISRLAVTIGQPVASPVGPLAGRLSIGAIEQPAGRRTRVSALGVVDSRSRAGAFLSCATSPTAMPAANKWPQTNKKFRPTNASDGRRHPRRPPPNGNTGAASLVTRALGPRGPRGRQAASCRIDGQSWPGHRAGARPEWPILICSGLVLVGGRHAAPPRRPISRAAT